MLVLHRLWHAPHVASVRIRQRVDADLSGLVEALTAQQPVTHYPLTWPLPFPAEQLLWSGADLAAWTAELSGRPVGHVAVRNVEQTSDEHVQAWISAHGRPTDGLAEVSGLFVGNEARGGGVGGQLLATAVSWTARHHLAPCLVVVSDPRNPAAAVYQHKGWAIVGRSRPSWLSEPAQELLAMVFPAVTAGSRQEATA
jgi:GNAT superfamily N-acetyltransferase